MIAGYPMSAQIESRNYERNIAEIEKRLFGVESP